MEWRHVLDWNDGSRQDGDEQCAVGAIKCRYDASDYYAIEIRDAEKAGIFGSWAQDYLRGQWQPKTGNDGVNLYETDPFHCASRWRVVDHRTSTARG